MSKFENKGLSSRLGARIIHAPKNAVLKLFHSTTRHTGADITATQQNEVHDAVLRAEHNKALGFRYLEKRKLHLI